MNPHTHVRRAHIWWLVAVFLSACGVQAAGSTAGQGYLTVAEGMARPATAGYLRAEQPREFSVPADHGPHPDYAVEWWYYTGNLSDTQGQRYGYQFTLFRTGLARQSQQVPASKWQSDAVYMAHLQ